MNISDRKISITIHSKPKFRLIILNDPWSRIDFVLEKNPELPLYQNKNTPSKKYVHSFFQVKNLNAACEFIT